MRVVRISSAFVLSTSCLYSSRLVPSCHSVLKCSIVLRSLGMSWKSVFILVQILIKGKDFQWINLTQLIFSTLFGFFVDGAKALLGNFTLPTYVGQLVMLLISIGVIALGISLYLDARLVSMPSEGMTLALADKLKKPFNQVKTWTDSTLVTLAILLSLIFMGGLYGVREGTILSALLIGPTIKPIRKWTKPVVERVFFGD